MMITCFLDPPNTISIVGKIGTFLPEKNHDSGTTGGDRIAARSLPHPDTLYNFEC